MEKAQKSDNSWAASRASVEEYVKMKDKVQKPASAFQRIGRLYAVCEDREEEDANPLNEKIINALQVIGHTHRNEFAIALNHAPFPVVLVDGKAMPEDPTKLFETATVSPYGNLHEGTTLVDKKVRDAREIGRERLKLTEEGATLLGELSSLYARNILGMDTRLDFEKESKKKNTSSQQQAVTQEGTWEGRIVCTLDKLNIYPREGHFAPHQDTPRKHKVGSLVVEFPYDHVGGEFILTCANKHYQPFSSGCLGACAFIGNVPHEVTPVKQGLRVSLSASIELVKKEHAANCAGCIECDTEPAPYIWDLVKQTVNITGQNKDFIFALIEAYVGDLTKPEYWRTVFGRDGLFLSDEVSDVPARAFTTDLSSLLASFFKRKRGLGVLLNWNYSLAELRTGILKSGDGFVVKALAQLLPGHESVLLPVIVQNHVEKEYEGGINIANRSVYYFTADQDTKCPAPLPEGIEFLSLCAGEVLYSDEQQEIERTGNNAENGYENNVYVHTAFIIWSPQPVKKKARH